MLALCANSLFLYRSPQRSKQNKHKTRQTKQTQTKPNITKQQQTIAQTEIIYIIIENVDTLCIILYSLPGHNLTPLETKQTKQNHNKVMDPTKDKENKRTGNNKPQ